MMLIVSCFIYYGSVNFQHEIPDPIPQPIKEAAIPPPPPLKEGKGYRDRFFGREYDFTNTAACGVMDRTVRASLNRWLHKVNKKTPEVMVEDVKQGKDKYIIGKYGAGSGGLADRLKGIMATLFIGWMSNRTVLIDWEGNADLAELLVPNLIHWHAPEVLRALRGQGRTIYAMQRTIPVSEVFAKDRVLVIMGNVPVNNRMIEEAGFAAVADLHGIPRELMNETRIERTYACLLEAFMTPSDEVRSIITDYMDQLDGAKLLCAQLRFGAHDYDAEFLPKGSEDIIFPELRKMIEAEMVHPVYNNRTAGKQTFDTGHPYAKKQKWCLWATSDVPGMLDKLRKEMSGLCYLDSKDASFHIAKRRQWEGVTREPVKQKLRRVLAEYLMFRECDKAAITEGSGFGILGMWQVPYESFWQQNYYLRKNGWFEPYWLY